MRTVVRGGEVVGAAGSVHADVLIEDGRITAVTQGPVHEGFRPDEVIDATGTLVLPGLVDSHVHLETPIGDTVTADDFDSGTAAAIAGGTTTVIDFAFQDYDGILEPLERRMQAAAGRSHADYGFHVVVTDPTGPVLDQMGVAAERGVCSFKAFMAYPQLRLGDRELLVALQRTRELGLPFVVHAEVGEIADLYAQRALEAGNTAPVFHAHTRPPEIEAEATRRAIELARWTGTPLFVFHVTCRGALAAVEEAQARGQAVQAETCIQYLLLDRESLEGPVGERFVCSPPLREIEDQDALWAALARGSLQVCSTDHCAFSDADKKEHRDDFTQIPNGLPTIEDRLTLLFEAGVAAGRLTPSDVVRVCSSGPARAFGLYPRKGTLEPGADADVVIFDPTRGRRISAADHHMNIDYNLFEGRRTSGTVRTVLSRGEVVYDEGRIVSRPGRGELVASDQARAISERNSFSSR